MAGAGLGVLVKGVCQQPCPCGARGSGHGLPFLQGSPAEAPQLLYLNLVKPSSVGKVG